MLERCMGNCGRAAGTTAKMRSRARKEASAQEVRGYYKQFAETKHLEHKSWVENEVFDLGDVRKVKPKNYETRRMVLTIKTDKQGNFLKLKARWVLRGFQDKQKEYPRTDSVASTRPWFRMSVNRDVACQLPPEAGHPPCIAARLKKLACGMNDASRRLWNILDKALCSCGMVPTRADRCCYVLYSIQARERTWNQNNSSQSHDTSNISNKPRVRSQGDAAFERMLDRIEGSPATGKSVAGITNLSVDDLFGTGGTEMEQRVLARSKMDFQVGSEHWNDRLFTRQRIRWMKDPQSGSYMAVRQERAVEELEEIPVERNAKEDLHCTPAMHTRYSSILGQINWLKSRTQFQCCYKFSRCA